MDTLVRLLQLLVLLLTLPLHLMALLDCWQPRCKSYFPYLMATMTAKSNRKMESKKQELFSQIEGLMGAPTEVELRELAVARVPTFSSTQLAAGSPAWIQTPTLRSS